MKKNRILTASELEKQAKETQADAAHIRDKAAQQRKQHPSQANRPSNLPKKSLSACFAVNA